MNPAPIIFIASDYDDFAVYLTLERAMISKHGCSHIYEHVAVDDVFEPTGREWTLCKGVWIDGRTFEGCGKFYESTLDECPDCKFSQNPEIIEARENVERLRQDEAGRLARERANQFTPVDYLAEYRGDEDPVNA